MEKPDLKKMRKAKGLTQRELAKELGISQPAVSRIERRLRPSSDVALILERWSGWPAGAWLKGRNG